LNFLCALREATRDVLIEPFYDRDPHKLHLD